MAVALAAVAAVLLADLVLVVARARREWRAGKDLSATSGVLITSLYALTAALLVMAIVWRPWRLDVPFRPAGLVGALLVLGGLALALPGFIPFASIRQLYGVERGRLITDGIYRWSRNPQYTGMGIALVGAAVIARSGLALLVAAAYWLAIRAWLVLEEEHLQAAFGTRYAQYRRETARFIGLPRASYFQAVRLYSLLEVCVFASLLVVAIGGLDEDAETVLGWTHGLGWIALCLAVALGCRRRVFPWPLLAATVSPLGPIGSSIGLEYLARRRRHPRRVA